MTQAPARLRAITELRFDNAYARLPDAFSVPVMPKPLADVQWVAGRPMPFKAFTTEVKGATLKASGMAADDWLMQLTVSFDGKGLSFERANVARAIVFIE